MTNVNARWILTAAVLSLGCGARALGGGSLSTDDATTTDVPMSEVSLQPDIPVQPDVPGLPDVPAQPDLPVAPDVPAGPDATVVAGCYVEDGAGPLCPAVRGATEASRFSLRVTQLDVTSPAALASPILLNVINSSVRAGGLLWGMSFDLAGMAFRTGSLSVSTRGSIGQGLLDGVFSYPSNNAGTLSVSGDRITTSTLSGTLRLPVVDGTGAMLTVLPLDAVRITATASPDRGCVGLGRVAGGRFNECTSTWATTSGQIDAVITVTAARSVTVSALMTTLCNLLAGSNCESSPQSAWTRQPDATVGGMPGYHLVANFAAVAATVR
ncbi:MAG: hypothetical protein U0326_24295 [Polyangiales bacterium]